LELIIFPPLITDLVSIFHLFSHLCFSLFSDSYLCAKRKVQNVQQNDRKKEKEKSLNSLLKEKSGKGKKKRRIKDFPQLPWRLPMQLFSGPEKLSAS